MGVTIAVARAADPKATGTQDVTTTDLGSLTPKGALTFHFGGLADETVRAHGLFSVAMTDGTTSRGIHWVSRDARATMDVGSKENSNAVILPNEANPNLFDGEASFDSWITNGYRIDWTSNPGSKGYYFSPVFFAGTDTSVHVGEINLEVAEDTEVNVTGPGWEPDVVIFAFEDSIYSGGFYMSASLGIAHNGTSLTQQSLSWGGLDNTATSDVVSRISTSYIATAYQHGSSVLYDVDCGNFDASGFSVWPRNGAGTLGSGASLYYMAIKFDGAIDVKIGTDTTSATVTTKATTGLGLTPDVVLLVPSWVQSLDTVETGTESLGVGVGTATSTAEFAGSFSDKDNVGTSIAKSVHDTGAIIQLDPADGTVDVKAALDSFASGSFTLDYSAATAARYFWYLALGAAAGGDPTISVSDSIAVGESVTPLLTELHQSVSDAVTVNESVSLTLTELHQSVSDAVTVAESVDLLLTELHLSVSDAVTVGESVSLTLTTAGEANASAADAVSVGESVDLLLTELHLSVTDTVTVGESVTLTLTELHLSVSDSATIVDSATVLLPTLSVAVTESLTAAESVDLLLPELYLDVSDSVAATESVDLLLDTLYISPTDSVTVTDSVTLNIPGTEYSISVSESISITELVVLSIFAISALRTYTPAAESRIYTPAASSRTHTAG